MARCHDTALAFFPLICLCLAMVPRVLYNRSNVPFPDSRLWGRRPKADRVPNLGKGLSLPPLLCVSSMRPNLPNHPRTPYPSDLDPWEMAAQPPCCVSFSYPHSTHGSDFLQWLWPLVFRV